MIYLDTSIFVSLLTGDDGTAVAHEWWEAQSVPLGISQWTAAEFYAYIGRRFRKGEETSRNCARIIHAFDDLIAANLTLLKCNETSVMRAAAWLRFPNCTLELSDALHLGAAVESEVAAIATFDKQFAGSIEQLRIPGLKVIALSPAGGQHRVHQERAQYQVTDRDLTQAVKFARKRKTAERASAGPMRVRGRA